MRRRRPPSQPLRRLGTKMIERSTTWPGLILAALAAAVSALLYDRTFILIDEGHIATIAARILDGQVLYRDVQTGIFPGVYYLTAALFGLFGEDIVVTRIAQVGVNIATVLVLWRLGLRAVSARWALVAPLIYIAMIPLGFPVYVMFAYSGIALLFGLAALLATFRYLEDGDRRNCFVAGVLLALCALTKQNYGALFGVGIAFALLWARPVSAVAQASLVRIFAPIVVGGALTTVAGLLPLIVAGAGPRLIQYSLLTIFDSQLTAFDQPLPTIFGSLPMSDGRWAFLYAPGILFNYLIRGEPFLSIPVTQGLRELALRLGYGFAMAPLFLAPLMRAGSRYEQRVLDQRLTDAVVVTGVVSFLGIFPSAIWSHLVAVLPPLLLLGAVVGQTLCARTTSNVLRVAVGASVAVTTAALLVGAAAAAGDLRKWNSEPIGNPHASLKMNADYASVLRQSVKFLEDCAAPGEPIYVAPDISGLFFLVDRPNPTQYDVLIPGDIDERVLIDRLNETGVRCMVYNPRLYIHFRELSIHFPMFTYFAETQFEQVAELRSGNVRWQGLRRIEESSR